MKSLLTRVVIALPFLLLAGCGGGQSGRALPTVHDDTTLAAGDVFDVRVYGEEELSTTYQVAADGSIDFPFLGTVEVDGMEPTAVAEKIAASLREGGFLVDPHVSVLVREYNSKTVHVTGAVTRPGNYPISPGMTVIQAISAAGGFTNLASRNDTLVTRKVDGDRTVRVRVRAGDMAEGETQDIPVQSRDIIFVPDRVF